MLLDVQTKTGGGEVVVWATAADEFAKRGADKARVARITDIAFIVFLPLNAISKDRAAILFRLYSS